MSRKSRQHEARRCGKRIILGAVLLALALVLSSCATATLFLMPAENNDALLMMPVKRDDAQLGTSPVEGEATEAVDMEDPEPAE